MPRRVIVLLAVVILIGAGAWGAHSLGWFGNEALEPAGQSRHDDQDKRVDYSDRELLPLPLELIPFGKHDVATIDVDSGMCAVTVAVPKDRSAGGVIYYGEEVDVLLTCPIIDRSDSSKPRLMTVMLAPECRVILKRRGPTNESDCGNEIIHFTLAANPYRAALMEFAKDKGWITLMPVPPLKGPTICCIEGIVREPIAIRKEFADDCARIHAMSTGELQIGMSDLQRIFPQRDPPIEFQTLK